MTETVQKLTSFDLLRPAIHPLAQGFFQWCVVTPDLDAKCAELEKLYGPAGFWIMENAPLLNVTYRGKQIDLRVDLALGYIGDTNIEVVRPRPDGDDNLYSEFLEERPEGGFHHLGFQVYDFEAAAESLTESHGAAVQSGDFGVDGTVFAYFDTTAVTGLYTEILYFDAGVTGSMARLRAGNPPQV
ncbi:VOC family protein [Actinoplanes friuliensis]|uniref:Lactoylglutathione lyase n=1 Tax=Actinoplanes friuliensis DSM 7358 TaxID=1246995 RepID=U5W4I8_9ACTN|nr:VOC family protein [Actinoplanes friuliensis]AGZ44113.1 lactoylglutathione lyase [Actinoplanes friuliensis DSM 7358]